MRQICELDNCTGCAACANKCPKNAISMMPNEEGFLYPHIDEAKCVNCSICERVCPSNRTFSTSEAAFYAGFLLDGETLAKSSSGGAFSAISEEVLNKGGVVFGACKDSNSHEVYHAVAETIEGLEPLRLSKYYQSNVGDVYEQVRSKLKAGVYVLFSGTACQIAALYAYLGEIDQGRLLTVDVICHGVASKKAVEGYLKSQEKKHKKKIKDFSFRVKAGKRGWQGGEGTRMKIEFTDGSVFIAERPYDTYFLGFNNNFFLRESCYRCKYCGTSRLADFTLADYWGVGEGLFSEEQLKAGISLLLVNTKKARAIFPEIGSRMHIVPIKKDKAIEHNRALRVPQERPKIRDTFFSMMDKHGYDYCIHCVFKTKFIKYELKNILKKLLPRQIAEKIMKNI